MAVKRGESQMAKTTKAWLLGPGGALAFSECCSGKWRAAGHGRSESQGPVSGALSVEEPPPILPCRGDLSGPRRPWLHPCAGWMR